ncbi:uncharacterized protein CLUP02_16951 [Colletotrichum lupini]|uniref:Uncharacterized protein n=3 Tax=Colletotrichum acutatum species complex TaxID=2707335 RepID=A0A9Q0BAL8_9PEZI|nr:uncharacterized protein CLUP02_16951 [Colletotrichum lupini]KAI3559022.1 hypothetical protein CABS02_01062 [Colletotrichum abscissum]UQC91416.1 hypothetical protein CLUP02_16951 [Colletotrichum lupini]
MGGFMNTRIKFRNNNIILKKSLSISKPMLCLKKTFARSDHDDSMNEKMPTTYDIKIAVAAYSIQRRVLETLHRTLLAELRQAHDTELETFQHDLKDDLRL